MSHSQKKLLAISDGVRESIQSWHELLLDLKERSFNVPKVVLGDGAVGLWAALDEVYLQTPQQRFWGTQECQHTQLRCRI